MYFLFLFNSNSWTSKTNGPFGCSIEKKKKCHLASLSLSLLSILWLSLTFSVIWRVFLSFGTCKLQLMTNRDGYLGLVCLPNQISEPGPSLFVLYRRKIKCVNYLTESLFETKRERERDIINWDWKLIQPANI